MTARHHSTGIKTPDGYPTNPYMYPLFDPSKRYGYRQEFDMVFLRSTPADVYEREVEKAEERVRRFVFSELERRHYTTPGLNGWENGTIHHYERDERTMGDVHRWEFPTMPREGHDVFYIGDDWSYVMGEYHRTPQTSVIEPVDPAFMYDAGPLIMLRPEPEARYWFDLYTGNVCLFFDHPIAPYAMPYASPAFHFPHPTVQETTP